MTSIDLSLSKSINFPISNLSNVLPGLFIIFSKIIFSVLLILYSVLFLNINCLFKSILIFLNLIIFFLFFFFLFFSSYLKYFLFAKEVLLAQRVLANSHLHQLPNLQLFLLLGLLLLKE